MPNLLTEEKKKDIFREFILRLVIVFLTFLFASFCLLIILIIPSYVLSQVKGTGVANEVKIFKETIEFRESNTPLILLGNEKIKLAALQSVEEIDFSALVVSVIQKKPIGIKLEKFFYEKIVIEGDSSKNKIKFVVNGVAEERAILIDFINRLKQEENFISVNFPVSNLLKGDSIDFSIEILVKSNN